jgi:hypothetical protein
VRTAVLAVVALAGCIPPRSPALQQATVTVDRPIDGVAIAVTTTDWLVWRLTVENRTDDAMAIVWDESSFIAGNGRSWGRIVPGSTRRIDVSKPHPPAPLPPRSTLTETVIAELPLQGGIDPYAMSPQMMNGSRMLLVVQTPTDKRTWQATLTTR